MLQLQKKVAHCFAAILLVAVVCQSRRKNQKIINWDHCKNKLGLSLLSASQDWLEFSVANGFEDDSLRW